MNENRTSIDPCDPWVIKLLGDYVTLRIVDVLRVGELRYTELQRRIADTNTVVLTDRLKKLHGAGIIERRTTPRDRRGVIYGLTKLGKEFLPVVDSLAGFARRAYPGPTTDQT